MGSAPEEQGMADPVEHVGAAAAELERRVRERLGRDRPRVAVTMGSGLGGLAEDLEAPLRVPYRTLPGWPAPTVAGHAGEVVIGTLAGVPVLGLRGRVHLYEGGPPARTGFYVRVVAALGVRILFLSNAAGAIRPGLRPGQLMLLSDHINLTGRSPLFGPVFGDETRFPDMSVAYDAELRGHVRDTATALGLDLAEGVYAAVHGPSYETPAEIRMLAALGADAVGMSTVPEVIVARAAGIRCVAVSCLSNFAAGVSHRPLDHQDVLEVTRSVEDDFRRLVAGSIAAFAAEREGGRVEDGGGG